MLISNVGVNAPAVTCNIAIHHYNARTSQHYQTTTTLQLYNITILLYNIMTSFHYKAATPQHPNAAGFQHRSSPTPQGYHF
ncbi:Hypothetical predicted protein [Octopus vulgaris]|uniref:Uncharacterized protein n=1 Tax=Octopus vulgaris TaxID=6645 RepID=A0AA36ANK1_OCTVU|nr:Hypothetical predicted protein [Octopus vulgaris]